MVAEVFTWAGAVLALLVLLAIYVVVISSRAERTERRRRERQLDSVYNARMRRERGD